jgi:excisionase family DNA binding protein
VPRITPATYSVEEVAALHHVSKLTLYRAIQRGDVPFPVIRIGRCIRIPREAVDRILAGETAVAE